MTQTNLPVALVTAAALALSLVPAFGQAASPAPEPVPAATAPAEVTLLPKDLRTIIRESTDAGERQVAFDQLAAAAADGDAKAALYLGDLYRSGTFVAEDLQKAADAYLMAIDKGDPVAARTLADMHLRGDAPGVTPEQALVYYQLAVDGGDGRAMQKLGDLYRDGKLVAMDPQRAADYYQLAVDDGLTTASMRLGDLYRKGLDPAASFAIYEPLAAAGDTAAMLRLGDAYRDGVGGQLDPAKAATYYQAALDAGAESAFNRLVGLYLATPETAASGVALLQDAFTAGTPGTGTRLANAYLQGQGVSVDIPRAVSILQEAAQAGDGSAARRLIRLYVDGKGKAFPRRPDLARQVLEQASAVLEEDAVFRDRLSIDAATARDTAAYSSVLERFGTLDGAARSSLAGQMGIVNPNAYVLFLQAHLQEEGMYGGSLSGMLTQSTINAFNAFCVEMDALSECNGGPLSSPARRVFRDALEQGT